MEKAMGGGDDAARAVGMCDRFLTFLTKNLSMNRQKNITEGPKDGGGDHMTHAQEEDDEFTVKIEKADFKFSQEEEEQRSVTATILEETSADARARDQLKEAVAEASRKVAATEASLAAAAAAVQEKKVRKSVTIKEEPAGDKEKAKKSMSKKRQASLSSGAAGVEEPVPRPPLRWGLRPRMPAANLRVPSNINEKSSNFIEERRKGFGAGGKREK
uniref:Uncharacterized protein n=1 Tax=Avena sativa TaxID=4498 RepID=A0ACD5WU39_AVESA